jgi:hypothetical protein
MRHHSRLISLTLIVLAGLVLLTGCDKKSISYVDMIKQEDREVKHFADSLGIDFIKDMPAGLVTPEKTFVEIDDGLYIRVIEKGEEVTGERRVISARMQLEGIGPRSGGDALKNMSNGGPYSGGTGALTFVYTPSGETVVPDPNQDAQEAANNTLQCEALLEGVRIAGVPSRVQIITSFRHGPIDFSKDGFAIYFKEVTYKYKK